MKKIMNHMLFAAAVVANVLGVIVQAPYLLIAGAIIGCLADNGIYVSVFAWLPSTGFTRYYVDQQTGRMERHTTKYRELLRKK